MIVTSSGTYFSCFVQNKMYTCILLFFFKMWYQSHAKIKDFFQKAKVYSNAFTVYNVIQIRTFTRLDFYVLLCLKSQHGINIYFIILNIAAKISS